MGFGSASFICSFLSWRATFYTVGFIGIAWSMMWLCLISSDPRDHKLLHHAELLYIQQSRANTRRSAPETEANKNPLTNGKVEEQDSQSHSKQKKKAAPWFRILTNPSVLVFIVVKFTVKMSTDSQTTQIPRYLDKVIGMDPKKVSCPTTCTYITDIHLAIIY